MRALPIAILPAGIASGMLDQPRMSRPGPLLQSDRMASLAVALSGAFWGLFWIPLRELEHRGFTGNWANVALYSAASLMLLPFLYWRGRPRRRDLGQLLVIGLFSGLGFALWNNALIYGAVVRVTLLFYLTPVWSTILGMLFLSDPGGPLRALSILFGIAGASMVLKFEGIFPVPRDGAEWCALVSGVCFALATVYVRKSHDVGSLEKTFANQFFAVPFALLLLIVLPAPAPTAAALLAGLPLILLGCIWLVPVMLLIVWGAGRLDPGRTAILLLLEVLASAISAALLTNEPFGWREVTGCVLILAAGMVEALDQLRPRLPRYRESL
jgi:drug/metabolite transporter (DMT)-like permease